MSIDYSDMAFPKPGKKKKIRKHKKSILPTQKGICFLCARLDEDYRASCTIWSRPEGRSGRDRDQGGPVPVSSQDRAAGRTQ